MKLMRFIEYNFHRGHNINLDAKFKYPKLYIYVINFFQRKFLKAF